MPVDIRIPELGESLSEAVIVRWLRQDGDIVRADEPLLEIETDKAAMELVADASGRLEIGEREGARLPAGAVVGRITEEVSVNGGGKPTPVVAETQPPHPAAQPAQGPRAETFGSVTKWCTGSSSTAVTPSRTSVPTTAGCASPA